MTGTSRLQACIECDSPPWPRQCSTQGSKPNRGGVTYSVLAFFSIDQVSFKSADKVRTRACTRRAHCVYLAGKGSHLSGALWRIGYLPDNPYDWPDALGLFNGPPLLLEASLNPRQRRA